MVVLEDRRDAERARRSHEAERLMAPGDRTVPSCPHASRIAGRGVVTCTIPPVNPSEFVAKWSGSTRTERAASQEHFIDICTMLGVPTPNTDPTGAHYAFEKGAEKTGGGDGFADVWKRWHFAWEYKGKKKDLKAAYNQLLQYREALANPPLLVVCDLNRFEVHTNFTGTAKTIYKFSLEDLARDPREPIRILRAVLTDPESLRPEVTPEQLTADAAKRFAQLASVLRSRGHEPHRVAHFLNKLVFCMFAEDAGLLPPGLINRLTTTAGKKPDVFEASLRELFGKMSHGGGMFGADVIDWFNGGLFDGDDVVPLELEEIATIREVSKLNWAEIEPAIFGTLFERGLDPDKRSQLGAHYTDPRSIMRVIDPVVLKPLRREFEAMKERVFELLAQGKRPGRRGTVKTNPQKVFESFLDRLRVVRVLDPACGSGNFLYLALRSLKDLEREVIQWGSLQLGMTQLPQVGPQVVKGVELNAYAAELARVTIWIGEIQWMIHNGFAYLRDPILRPMENIHTQDAILDMTDPSNPREPEWPHADFIIGNPPFLGNRLLRRVLGSDYTEALFRLYSGRLPAASDLCCYWFEKARDMINSGKVVRAGLLATQGIRGGASRRALERIKESGDIFMAWADEEWILEGAAVHVSIVGFDKGTETERTLDDEPAANINTDLTSGVDLTRAKSLPENRSVAFYADVKGGPFDIPEEVAKKMLGEPNPDGRSNADVIRPWVNATDVTRRPRHMWIIDFGVNTSQEEAALYETPFEYVKEHVRPTRLNNRRKAYREEWWLHVEPCSGMRNALKGLTRYIATPAVAKHRLFVWLDPPTLADHALVVIARDDDFTFGVLQSRPHELWARGTGTQLREAESGFRYTPTTTFETFPFPRPTEEQRAAIELAAKSLVRFRDGWLNPSGVGLSERKKRPLTNLYNAQPDWLQQAHAKLDRVVLAAYGWTGELSDEELLSKLLALNLERAAEAG